MDRVLLILYILGEYGPVERPILAKQFLIDFHSEDYLRVEFLLQRPDDDNVINFLRYLFLKYVEGVPEMGIDFDVLNSLALEELHRFKRYLSILPVTIGFESISLFNDDGFPLMKRRLVIRWHLPVVRDPSAVSGQIRIVSRKYSVANSTFIGIPQDNTSPPLSLIQLESLFSLPTMIVNRNSLLDLHTKSRVIVPNQFENWARCDFRSIKSTISHFRGRWEIPESRPFLFQSKTVALPHVPIGDVESLRGLLQENHPNLSDVYYTTYPSDSDLIKMVLSNEGVTEIVLGSFYAEWTDDEQLSRMLIQDVINHIDIQTLYQDVREALKEEEVLVVIDGSNLAIIELGDVVRVTGPPAIAIEAGPRLRKH